MNQPIKPTVIPSKQQRKLEAHRANLDPSLPHAFFLEQERSQTGTVTPIASIFLTNRHCPWQCFMCDLWQNTLTYDTPPGAIPKQIDHTLAELRRSPPNTHPRQIKLYNSGSFFDRRAIPPEDHQPIAERLRGFDRVIIECHPALVNNSALEFRDRLGSDTRLEIAMGLETVHPEALPRLNKGMTLQQFAAAADFLRTHDIDLRVFILVKPPFLPEAEAVEWSNRSVDFANQCHATVASLIPTRLGNAPLDQLAAQGEFTPPKLSTLEQAAEYGITQRKARIFADLWDLEKFSDCPTCFNGRKERLNQMNLTQSVQPPKHCATCQLEK